MTGRISYMGTKHELAPAVREVLKNCRPGLLLDAFAGMGAIAESLAGDRNVWTNDVQHFAHLATSCRLADKEGPLSARSISRMATPLFKENLRTLIDQNRHSLAFERKALKSENFKDFLTSFERALANSPTHEGAYGCFTKTYSLGYFSLRQSVEIDSIRYALEILKGRDTITKSQFRWGLLALGATILRIANTTGHFAQYLTPNLQNYQRVIKQFQRRVWKEWQTCISRLQPVGTSEWRRNNYSTRCESISLFSGNLPSLKPHVVYCDPPYTNDQYSRYYHIWETLVLYDYPNVTGRGRYRPDRFTTDFCLASQVKAAFESLVIGVSQTGSDLVLSYPSNGLLHGIGVDPLDLLRQVYPSARVAAQIDYRHSTMGASKGNATALVKERIYLATA